MPQPSSLMQDLRRRLPAEVWYEVRRRNRLVPAGAIVLGNSTTTGEKVSITENDRRTHLRVMGPTAAGKTKALELIVRRLIEEGEEAVVILDPNRDFADDVKRFCYATGQTDRVIVFDPAEQRDTILGFNPMAVGGTDIETEAWRDAQAFLRVLGGQDPLSTPRLLRWLYNLCVALRSARVTYAEALELLRAKATDAGRGITRLVLQPDVRGEWDYVNADATGAFRRTEQLESTYSRLRAFLNNPTIRHMIGQTEQVLDPADIIDNKRILIVPLQQGPGLTDEDTRFLGTMIFSALLREAISRPPHARRPFTIAADEFWKFISNEAIEVLTTGRKYRCSLIMAHQHPYQLIRTGGSVADAGVLEAANSCARTAIIFGDLMPEQYRDFAQKLAVRTWNPRQVKEELYALRQIVTGHERTTVHGRGVNHSTIAGAGDAVPYFASPFGGRRDAEGGTYSESASETDSWSESESETFLPQFHTFKELTKREYVSYQEHELAILQQLVNQPDRNGCLIRKGAAGQFFRVADVEPVRITDAEVVACDRRVLENPANPYAPVVVVQAQLVSRIAQLEQIEADAAAREEGAYATTPRPHERSRPKAQVRTPRTTRKGAKDA